MALQDVFIKELRDLYSAENQTLKSMPKLTKACSNAEVKAVMLNHIQESKNQVERLKQIFGILDKKPTGQHCNGMEGIVEEGKEALESDEEGAVHDVELIGAGLRVEHYEIAGYIAAIAIAKSLGQKEIVSLLTETLKEEQNAAKSVLSAAKTVFKEAGQEEDAQEEEDDDEPQDAEETESKQESEEDEREAAPELKKRTTKKTSERTRGPAS